MIVGILGWQGAELPEIRTSDAHVVIKFDYFDLGLGSHYWCNQDVIHVMRGLA